MNNNCYPVRVLHVLTGLSSGGAESFIMNMYRNMDRNLVQFDFLLRSEENVYKEELDAMGSRVYTTASFPRYFIRNAIETARFFKDHKYDIIHVHANALLYMYALKCARKSGVKCRIIHSHNTAMAHMLLLPIHNANKKRIPKFATDYFACADMAGSWMFNGDYSVVHNAIDLDKYAFDQRKRTELRRQLGIQEDALVLGHVGRFVPQKNHGFLIDLFDEVARHKPDARLVLLGDGDLRGETENKVRNLGLSDRVIFLGARQDVADWLNVFDLFVFPSVYEGLAVVAIEAQANGLGIVCSEAVSDQAIFSGHVMRIGLNEGLSNWANAVLSADTQRRSVKETLTRSGYDIRTEAAKLQAFYLSKVK